MHDRNGAAKLLTLLLITGATATAAKAATRTAAAPTIPPAAPSAGGSADEIGPTDLSVCEGPRRSLGAAEAVDAAEFAARLHGTWVLANRTIRGLTIDTNTHFFFDFSSKEKGRATGTAVLIDYGNLEVLDPLSRCAACLADATVSALWEVTVEAPTEESLELIMAGEYFGSYGEFQQGVRATERSSYVRRGGQYLSGRVVTPGGGYGKADDVWDRIGLANDNLIYVSCKGLYVERYVKVSAETPRLDGRQLREAWAKRKQDGSLLKPVPVVPRWKSGL